MQVAPPGAKIGTNANCITYWPMQLEPMQVVFFLAGEITQVKESIPWVRCDSGNVFLLHVLFFCAFQVSADL